MMPSAVHSLVCIDTDNSRIYFTRFIVPESYTHSVNLRGSFEVDMDGGT